MANIITSSGILCSIVLLFFPAFSPCFYFFYIICGFSDMIDGTVARKQIPLVSSVPSWIQ